jgi:hypothetical protein
MAILSACVVTVDKSDEDDCPSSDQIREDDGGGEDDGGSEDDSDPGLPILGGNTHSSDSVIITELVGAHELSDPMDLAFNPSSPGELWIVNQGDHSMSIADADTDDWSARSVDQTPSLTCSTSQIPAMGASLCWTPPPAPSAGNMAPTMMVAPSVR